MPARNLMRFRLLAVVPAAAVLAGTALALPATAQDTSPRPAHPAHLAPQTRLWPGNLLVSGSTYIRNPGIVAGQTVLPPGCTSGCVTATAGGSYPQVFNNVLVDPAFGVTSPVFLDELTPSGTPLGTIRVPDGTPAPGQRANGKLVTSFPSKSELALNLSTDGRYVMFMGYDPAPDQGSSSAPGPTSSPRPGCRRPPSTRGCQLRWGASA